MEILFWALAFLSIYSYALFPLLVFSWSRIRSNPWHKADIFPFVSILISVHNEETVIAGKVRNALSLHYPSDRMEVIVVSDGSTDGTEELVTRFDDPRVKLRSFSRLGKSACLNQAIQTTSSDILVFTDANALFPPDLLSKLVRNFSDERIGLVTGATRYYNGHGIEEVTGSYSKLERWVKQSESLVDSCVGADGALFAMRRNLWVPLRDNEINDFVIPLRVIEQGFRVVLDLECFCREPASPDERAEFRRQVRISNRTLWAILRNARFANPVNYGSFAFFLISHKLLRFCVPFFLVSSISLNILLLSHHPAYYFTIFCFAFLFLMGILNHRHIVRDRVSGIFRLFLLTICAQMLGFLRMLVGIEDKIWTPER